MVSIIDAAASWRERAACRDRDPDQWFPHWNEPRKRAHAVEVCRACPVWADCLEYALVTAQLEGIWGGLTPAQRLKVSPVTPTVALPPDDQGNEHGTKGASRRHTELLQMPCPACAAYRRQVAAKLIADNTARTLAQRKRRSA